MAEPVEHTNEWLGLAEAAALLEISPEGVRKRLLRGHLPGKKNKRGVWLIDRAVLERLRDADQELEPLPDIPDNPLPDLTDAPNRPNQPDCPDKQPVSLVSFLQEENKRLWAELEREREQHRLELDQRAEELRRKDILLSELTRRLPALPESVVCPDPPRAPWWQFWKWRWW
jgi:hypothetical protein